MKNTIFILLTVVLAALCLAPLSDLSGPTNLYARNDSPDVVVEKIGIESRNRAVAVQTTSQSLRDAESTGFC